MPLGLLRSMASRPLSRSRRCRLQLKVSPREPVKLVVVFTGHTARLLHPRVWDHEVPLVMSQVIQATGRRILHTWVVAPLDDSPSRILENHSFVLRGPDRVGVLRMIPWGFRLFATWRSDSALSSESSKNARQWHFIRAEGSSNGSWRSRRALQPTCRSRRALEPTCRSRRASCSESASGIWCVISPFGIGYWYCDARMKGTMASTSSQLDERVADFHYRRGPDQPSSSSLARRVRVQPLLLSLLLFVR